MSDDEYADDFDHEEAPAPAKATHRQSSANTKLAAAAVSAPRPVSSISSTLAAASISSSSVSKPAAAVVSSSSATSSAADATRIRELEARVEALQAEVSASRVKLRRAGRPGIGGGSAAAATGVDDAAAAAALAASACSSLGSNTARELPFTSLTLGHQISGGGFCLLYKGAWLGVDVAIKRMFDPNMSAAQLREFATECAMLANLQHPHIVQLLGACSVPPNLALVTDFCARGSLYHVLHEDVGTELSRARKASMALQLAHALAFVHASGVVHRDVKAHNVLAESNFRIRLCDFGMARTLAQLHAAPPEAQGTPNYMAPELFQNAHASCASDMYAYGILLVEIFSRSVPFDGVGVASIRQKVLAGERPKVEATVPREVAQLARECTAQTPQARPQGFGKVIQLLAAMAAQTASG